MNRFLSIRLIANLLLVRSLKADSSCRSNETHVAWRMPLAPSSTTMTDRHEAPDKQMSASTLAASSSSCHYQTLSGAKLDAYSYLSRHIMGFDRPFQSTLGFAADDDDDDQPDGLGNGLVGPTIDLALEAKQHFSYTDELPKQMWQEYVLNYANLNEARSNWRPLIHARLLHNATATETNATKSSAVVTRSLPETVEYVNRILWTTLAPAHVKSITFASGQTPLIFDPMSIMAFGHASCTGLAILFTNALRSMGVPARVAGTPAWYRDASRGNHNWVEVYHDRQWFFLEPSPSAGMIDTLERNPCERWFCNRDRFAPPSAASIHCEQDDADCDSSRQQQQQLFRTEVYAARLSTLDVFFPMAWETSVHDVPGEDVSQYYQRVCSQCD